MCNLLKENLLPLACISPSGGSTSQAWLPVITLPCMGGFGGPPSLAWCRSPPRLRCCSFLTSRDILKFFPTQSFRAPMIWYPMIWFHTQPIPICSAVACLAFPFCYAHLLTHCSSRVTQCRGACGSREPAVLSPAGAIPHSLSVARRHRHRQPLAQRADKAGSPEEQAQQETGLPHRPKAHPGERARWRPQPDLNQGLGQGPRWGWSGSLRPAGALPALTTCFSDFLLCTDFLCGSKTWT